jgi:hypothetical protein
MLWLTNRGEPNGSGINKTGSQGRNRKVEPCIEIAGRPSEKTVYTSRTVDELPEYIAVSPITVACPRCHAEPGKVCEVLVGRGLEIVHIERIKVALAMDVSAKDRLARARIPSKPSE